MQSKKLSPLAKQSKVTAYYSRKSPKATSIRGTHVEQRQFQGAIGPLLGDMGESPVHGDHPSDEASAKQATSKAEAGCPEVRGRAARDKGGGNRVKKTLGILVQGPEERIKGFAQRGAKGKGG